MHNIYSLCVPAGWIAGHYPNEFAIAKQIKMGQLQTIPNEFYLYFTLILVVALVGIKYQYTSYKKQKRLEGQAEADLFSQELEANDLNEEGEEQDNGSDQDQEQAENDEEGSQQKSGDEAEGARRSRKDKAKQPGEQGDSGEDDRGSGAKGKASRPKDKGSRGKQLAASDEDEENELKNFDQIESDPHQKKKNKKKANEI